MIDDFLANLFTPDSPATFAQRFAPFEGAPASVPEIDGGTGAPDDILRRLAPPMPSTRDYLRTLPADPPINGNDTIDEMSARSNPSVPLPQARPDIESILGGVRSNAAPTTQTPTAAPTGGGQDLMAKLSGLLRGGQQSATPAPAATGQATPLGRLFGLSPAQDRSIRASLAGGFAGGNPAFAGGALMRGASGALSGGLKSEEQTRQDDKKAADDAQKQSNFERTQGDKEKTSEALRKLYGMRGAVMEQNATTRATNAGKTSWNKPASERWKDANRLIIDKEKQLKGAINPMLPKADRDAQTAAASAELDAFKRQTFKQYGFDENGQDTAPMQRKGGEVPSSGKVVGDKEATEQGLYPKGTYDDPAEPASQEEFDALPAGAIYRNPADGQLYTKRGQ